MRFGIIALVLLSASVALRAQQGSDPSRAMDGGFGAMLFVTDDESGFRRAWDAPGNPPVPTTNNLTREREVYALVVFSGCAAGADGRCDVQAELAITDPDGSPYHKPETMAVWHDAPPREKLHLSPAAIAFRLDPGASRGSYKVTARVFDRVANKVLTVQRTMTASGGGGY